MNSEDNYPYITMYKNYIDNKEIITPWDILKISKTSRILFFDFSFGVRKGLVMHLTQSAEYY